MAVTANKTGGAKGKASGGGAKPPGTAEESPTALATPISNAPKTPVGVVVVEDNAPSSGMEMNKLLRQSRYYDVDFEDTAMRCFRCGGNGHTSRDCKNEVRQKPCILCAQFGHMRSECPQALCFKCKRPGHVSRDCPNANSGGMPQDQPCLRCGSRSCSCAGQADYVRAYGGCTAKYNKSDLALVRCYVCYSHGHLTCKQTPKSVPRVSCFNCGQDHYSEDCFEERPPAVRGEQAELARAQQSMMSQQWNSGGQMYGGGNGRREVWYDQQPAYDDWSGGGYHQRGGGGSVWDRMRPADGRYHRGSYRDQHYQHDAWGNYSGQYDRGPKRGRDWQGRESFPPPSNKHTRFY